MSVTAPTSKAVCDEREVAESTIRHRQKHTWGEGEKSKQKCSVAAGVGLNPSRLKSRIYFENCCNRKTSVPKPPTFLLGKEDWQSG